MNGLGRLVYRSFLVLITLAVTVYLFVYGREYYETPLEERFYHSDHALLKASGFFGHGLGIVGTLLIAIGVFGYIYAKRTLRFERIVRLKYLLEFHIFLCTLGPIMVLFHTTFKFGGIVSIGFWSMTLVVLSGILGRYIYVQIPRTMSGRELSLKEIEDDLRVQLTTLASDHLGNEHSGPIFDLLSGSDLLNPEVPGVIKNSIQKAGISRSHRREAQASLRRMKTILRRIRRLDRMRALFHYWHVIHKPFALIMLVIVLLHVAVTLSMGYTWTF